SPAMATIRERYRITLGIGISATRSDTRNCRRHGSRTFGGIRQAALFECLSPTRCLGKKDFRGTLAGRCNPKDATARARRARAVSLAAKLPCWATPARPVMLWPPADMAWPLLGARVKGWFENTTVPQHPS